MMVSFLCISGFKLIVFLDIWRAILGIWSLKFQGRPSQGTFEDDFPFTKGPQESKSFSEPRTVSTIEGLNWSKGSNCHLSRWIFLAEIFAPKSWNLRN